jgi:hypothetical protein
MVSGVRGSCCRLDRDREGIARRPGDVRPHRPGARGILRREVCPVPVSPARSASSSSPCALCCNRRVGMSILVPIPALMGFLG